MTMKETEPSEQMYYIEGKPHCYECAPDYCSELPKPSTFDDTYDGEVGGLHCDSCGHDFTPRY